jgi:hypothetical protein
MTDRESFEFPLGRWLMWGFIALVAVIVGLAILAGIFSGDEDTDPGATADQVEWSIEVSEYAPSPGEVTLKGDVPLGFPTETWKDGVQLLRSVDARQFEWNMNVSPEVPVPVYEIDEASDCGELNDLLSEWASNTGSAPGEGQRAQAEAFAQHAYDTMMERGCETSAGG